MDVIERIVQFVEYAEMVRNISENKDLDWPTKYDRIFGQDGLSTQIRQLYIDLPWNDPAADYEADVTAYRDALELRAENFRVILDKLNEKGK